MTRITRIIHKRLSCTRAFSTFVPKHYGFFFQFCFYLMFTLLVTDTGLDHSTSQIHLYHTRTALFCPAVTVPSLHRHTRNARHNTVTRLDTLPSLAVHLPYMSLNALLECSALFRWVFCQKRLSVSSSGRDWHIGKPGRQRLRGSPRYWALLFSASLF